MHFITPVACFQEVSEQKQTNVTFDEIQLIFISSMGPH